MLQVSGFAWRNGYAVWLLEQLASAAALLVLAVPEGLPLTASTVLAYASERMLGDRLLVRHLVCSPGHPETNMPAS